jgi:hypothetical protein
VWDFLSLFEDLTTGSGFGFFSYVNAFISATRPLIRGEDRERNRTYYRTRIDEFLRGLTLFPTSPFGLDRLRSPVDWAIIALRSSPLFILVDSGTPLLRYLRFFSSIDEITFTRQGSFSG